MNNTRKARQVIADARDLLGGNGILLIVGRDITGVSAFA
jgi:hypothetical protein